MVRWLIHTAVVVTALLATSTFASWVEATPAEPQTESDRSVSSEELRRGGYVLFIRHTSTNREDEKDQNPVDLNDCSTQRNLTEEGEDEARRLGQAISDLHIPIAEVLSSPYCRCFDTVILAFGGARKVAELGSPKEIPKGQQEQRIRFLRELLNESPAVGQNRVIISHSTNLWQATGILLDENEEGYTVPFHPQLSGEPQHFKRIAIKDWEDFIALDHQHLEIRKRRK